MWAVLENGPPRDKVDLLALGVHGFLVPSGTGEFYTLTARQRRRATEIVAGAAKGKAPVISMTAETGTRKALEVIADARWRRKAACRSGSTISRPTRS